MKLKLISRYVRLDFTLNSRGLKMALLKPPNIETGGPSSRTMDHMHVVFLDYDNAAESLVKEELVILQRRFRLTPFYLFCSSSGVNKDGVRYGNYHAISLTKRTMKGIMDIQERSSTDIGHGLMRHNLYRSWVLRAQPKLSAGKEVKGKPVYLSCVGDKAIGKSNEISTGHLMFLMKHYGIPVPNYGRQDGFTRIWDTEYDTHKE